MRQDASERTYCVLIEIRSSIAQGIFNGADDCVNDAADDVGKTRCERREDRGK